jgi:hypothetical protein
MDTVPTGAALDRISGREVVATPCEYLSQTATGSLRFQVAVGAGFVLLRGGERDPSLIVDIARL